MLLLKLGIASWQQGGIQDLVRQHLEHGPDVWLEPANYAAPAGSNRREPPTLIVPKRITSIAGQKIRWRCKRVSEQGVLCSQIVALARSWPERIPAYAWGAGSRLCREWPSE